LSELDHESRAVDQAVLDSGAHNHFSSSMDWALPAHRAFSPARSFEGFAIDGSYITLAENQHPHGFCYLEPLEAQWGLQCPLLGSDPHRLVESLEDLFHHGLHRWLCLILSGIIPETPLYDCLRRRFAARAQAGMSRYVASLDGGVDGYLARRSRNQRKSIASAMRAAARFCRRPHLRACSPSKSAAGKGAKRPACSSNRCRRFAA
jgi:hypothetical protein